MHVIKKTMLDPITGHENTIWQAKLIIADIDTDIGQITLYGWKDQAAYESGKQNATQYTVQFQLSTLQTFESVWSEVAGVLLTTTVFIGGEMILANKYNPTPIPPIDIPNIEEPVDPNVPPEEQP